MAKLLNVELFSQAKIRQEGQLETQASGLAVGQRRTEFFLPHLEIVPSAQELTQPAGRVQGLVEKINQFVDNIADDYFLLGLHLITLHELLKGAGLATDQVKTWYAEHINMPYSSAMQCKKVAETYAEQPELINRYTASGAYLLSSLRSEQEREVVFQRARGQKAQPTVRELRLALKEFQEKAQRALPGGEVLIAAKTWPREDLHRAMDDLQSLADRWSQAEEHEEREVGRQRLLARCRQFMHWLDG